MKYTIVSIELALHVLYNSQQEYFYSIVIQTLTSWGSITDVIDMSCEIILKYVMPKMKT